MNCRCHTCEGGDECPESPFYRHGSDHDLSSGLEAERVKLTECLINLSKWAETRAAGVHNTATTLAMLERRVKEIRTSVAKAGRKAVNQT